MPLRPPQVSNLIATHKLSSADERPVEILASAAFVTHNATLETFVKVHTPIVINEFIRT